MIPRKLKAHNSSEQTTFLGFFFRSLDFHHWVASTTAPAVEKLCSCWVMRSSGHSDDIHRRLGELRLLPSTPSFHPSPHRDRKLTAIGRGLNGSLRCWTAWNWPPWPSYQEITWTWNYYDDSGWATLIAEVFFLFIFPCYYNNSHRRSLDRQWW